MEMLNALVTRFKKLQLRVEMFYKLETYQICIYYYYQLYLCTNVDTKNNLLIAQMYKQIFANVQMYTTIMTIE